MDGPAPSLELYEIAGRLGLSVLLGGAIGLQRELERHPAGIRTHILVSVGSTLFMLVSAFGFQDWANAGLRTDPSRVSAQVVSGIGFLGGGAIVKHGFDVQGLTTAATLWVTAGVGLAVGINEWVGAVLTVIIVLVTLEFFKRVEAFYWTKKSVHVIKVESLDEGTIGKIVTLFTTNYVKISKIERVANGEKLDATFTLHLPKGLRQSPNLMLNIIRGVEGVTMSNVVLLDGKNKSEWTNKTQKVHKMSEIAASPPVLPANPAQEHFYSQRFMDTSKKISLGEFKDVLRTKEKEPKESEEMKEITEKPKEKKEKESDKVHEEKEKEKKEKKEKKKKEKKEQEELPPN